MCSSDLLLRSNASAICRSSPYLIIISRGYDQLKAPRRMRLIIAGFIIFRKEIVSEFTKCTVLEAWVDSTGVSSVTKRPVQCVVTDR